MRPTLDSCSLIRFDTVVEWSGVKPANFAVSSEDLHSTDRRNNWAGKSVVLGGRVVGLNK